MIDPRPYLDIPFAENGRDRGGCDCWGIVRLIYQDVTGITLPLLDTCDSLDTSAVRDAMPAEARNWVEVLVGPLPRGGERRLRELDVLLLRRIGRPAHVGVVIGSPHFLHSELGAGVNVKSVCASPWPNRLAAAYRHPTLA